MQYAEAVKRCQLCGGSGEHRWVPVLPNSGPHYDTDDDGNPTCNRCNGTGIETVRVVIAFGR